MKFTEGDSLEGSAHTPMDNPHILPLKKNMMTILKVRKAQMNWNNYVFDEG